MLPALLRGLGRGLQRAAAEDKEHLVKKALERVTDEDLDLIYEWCQREEATEPTAAEEQALQHLEALMDEADEEHRRQIRWLRC